MYIETLVRSKMGGTDTKGMDQLTTAERARHWGATRSPGDIGLVVRVVVAVAAILLVLVGGAKVRTPQRVKVRGSTYPRIHLKRSLTAVRVVSC